MSRGVVVDTGAVWFAGMLSAASGIEEIKYCALGSGDWEGAPPDEDATQTALRSEFARKFYTRKSYLVPDEIGTIRIGDTTYTLSEEATRYTMYEFKFERDEGNDQPIREYGFFADDASLNVEGYYGEGGLWNEETNPTGEVENLGTLVIVKHVPLDSEGNQPQKNSDETLTIRVLIRT